MVSKGSTGTNLKPFEGETAVFKPKAPAKGGWGWSALPLFILWNITYDISLFNPNGSNGIECFVK